ncbi:acyltransferase [Shewanella sp. JBTF-M18]|uniref:Acyltransferase n=1 Tax=Shewanella insulae TaxID=2681496 RepID=A0A6L7HZH7_9GAMM|nr:acyltransferase [Shewanella insulae]MXR69410.1 acyltransferase [Shewanella insulae]
MMHKISLVYAWMVWLLTAWMPDLPMLMRLRGFLYSLFMARAGRNFQVSSGARLYGLKNISVGNDVFVAVNVVINAGGKIIVGDEVMFGIGAVVVSGNHTLVNGSYRFGPMDRKAITVGSGSWIGANVTLLAGSSVPNSSLVAANAVVTKHLEIVGVYGGVPAKFISSNLK